MEREKAVKLVSDLVRIAKILGRDNWSRYDKAPFEENYERLASQAIDAMTAMTQERPAPARMEREEAIELFGKLIDAINECRARREGAKEHFRKLRAYKELKGKMIDAMCQSEPTKVEDYRADLMAVRRLLIWIEKQINTEVHILRDRHERIIVLTSVQEELLTKEARIERAIKLEEDMAPVAADV